METTDWAVIYQLNLLFEVQDSNCDWAVIYEWNVLFEVQESLDIRGVETWRRLILLQIKQIYPPELETRQSRFLLKTLL